jgi:hypothetical protein
VWGRRLLPLQQRLQLHHHQQRKPDTDGDRCSYKLLPSLTADTRLVCFLAHEGCKLYELQDAAGRAKKGLLAQNICCCALGCGMLLSRPSSLVLKCWPMHIAQHTIFECFYLDLTVLRCCCCTITINCMMLLSPHHAL